LESLSIANYSTSLSYDFVIAQAGSLFGTGFADGTNVTNLFDINSTAFNGGSAANQPNGGFKVVTSTLGVLRVLNLVAVPEPSTGSLLLIGFGGLALLRMVRRRSVG
ncbi:MAG: PEP-CTERM sorting domain-containing protein, partial [Verrucomicrobia bacterium]|nr:PEP-CTERM sorting domain-containing protein [Verrucomicrobiota bacterium]